jgi:hypothetical protein
VAEREPREPPQRGPRTLFEIPFHSSMDDGEAARLHKALDLVTYLSAKPGVSGGRPGVVPLDLWSGLFLERGEQQGEWQLVARSWGDPPEQLVHEWQVRAALAARELDRTVAVPAIEPRASDETPLRPVGRAANRRLARLRRRLTGLDD